MNVQHHTEVSNTQQLGEYPCAHRRSRCLPKKNKAKQSDVAETHKQSPTRPAQQSRTDINPAAHNAKCCGGLSCALLAYLA